MFYNIGKHWVLQKDRDERSNPDYMGAEKEFRKRGVPFGIIPLMNKTRHPESAEHI